MLDLVPRRIGEWNLLLVTPWKGRVILLGIALIFGGLMVGDGRFSLFPGLLAAISGLAGLYTEKWQFDTDRQVVIHTEGLFFLKRKKSIALQEVVRIELRNSKPRKSISQPGLSSMSDPSLDQIPHHKPRSRGLSGLFLLLVGGREIGVHTTSSKKAQEQERLGQSIARVCRKPFSVIG